MLNMIFGGVFERNPKLKFISAENEAGWATHILERADFEWLRYQNVAVKDFEGRIPEKPSDYFKRNIKLTFLRDTVAIRTHDLLGTDTLMFQTDFPHGISRSEEHTSELQSLMRISYAVFCLKKKTQLINKTSLSLHETQ